MKYFCICTLIFLAGRSTAQIPVSKEPRHHPVFENKNVRILNVLLPVGDTTQYHVHSTPSIFIGLSTTRTGSQLLNQQPATGLFRAGSMFFEDLSAPHTRTHRVWNIDTAVFHVMDIELLSVSPGPEGRPMAAAHLQLETDTTGVRIYRISLDASQSIHLHEAGRSFVIVALQSAKINPVINSKHVAGSLMAGDFFWINAGDQFEVKNTGGESASLALIEIK